VPSQTLKRSRRPPSTASTRAPSCVLVASAEGVKCYTGDAMSGDGPKTAYELAMERLRQKDRESAVEEHPLTDAQKASLAEVRKVYQAKVAEREILHRDALVKARSHEEIEKLNEEMRRDLERLTGERDRKIDAIRKRT
jgi:delta 1-pyrroline-5-carboxylate dehydrogenase